MNPIYSPVFEAQIKVELDILQAKIENAKVYTELNLKDIYGGDALVYELEK